MKMQVGFEDFAKLDLRVGEVVEATAVEESPKLVQLSVNFGEELGTKTIFAGVRKWYEPEKLVGRKFMFVVNLAPKEFKFGISEGMIIAAGDEEAVLYSFDKDLPAGAVVK